MRPKPAATYCGTGSTPALAKELRKRGFVFTGPVTVYAAMQSCGLVNDHLADCFASAGRRASPGTRCGRKS
jgi:DNA-3-methyladenine glycosylase I